MTIILTALALVIVYLFIGLNVTRYQYALRKTERRDLSDSERQLRIQVELAQLQHDICNLNYRFLADRGCDCGKKAAWLRLRNGEISMERPSYSTVLTYPFIGVDIWVRSGEIKTKRTIDLQKEINRLEQLNEIEA